MSKVEDICRNATGLFEQCEGAFIDRISFCALTGRDILEIGLAQVPNIGEVVIYLENVRYLVLDNPDVQGSFVDSISATYLPKLDSPWPQGAEELLMRFPRLPELIWVRLIGSAGISAVGQTMTVSIEQDLSRKSLDQSSETRRDG